MINPKYREVESDDADDYYDEYGHVSPHGLYDAGGHIITDRWAEYADFLHDRMRDEEFRQ